VATPSRACFVLIGLAVLGCERRVHVVGRVAISDAAQAADVGAPVADSALDGPATDAGGQELSIDRAPWCRPDGECVVGANSCFAPCRDDASVTLCFCEEGHWICNVERYRCAGEPECVRPRSCGSSPSPCYYCDATQGRAVRCDCPDQSPEWTCQPLDVSCE
jgi:hypothetical protein